MRSVFVSDKTTAFIGRTPDGSRVYVTIELRDKTWTGSTIHHEPIDGYQELGVCGWEVPKHARTIMGGGQNIDTVRTVAPDPSSWFTRADLRSLVALWDRWHLNGLRAGCAHQVKPSMHSPHGYPQVDLDSVAPCPETGYRYGHAWLVETLPDEVVAEVRRLIALPTGRVPEYVPR